MNRSRQQTFYIVCCDCAECLADEYQYADPEPFKQLTLLLQTEREARKELKELNHGTHDSLFVSKYVILETEQRPRARKRQLQATAV